MDITLLRHSYHPACTMGWLHAGEARFATIEKPWLDNAPSKSCIPEGTYRLTHHNSEKFPKSWLLHNVPGRSAILIHAGNTAYDVIGCIAIAMEVSRESLAIRRSRDAMRALYEILKYERHMTITVALDRKGLL